MRILAIGAHFDDIEIGCGGSLLRWKEEGHEILFYVATKSGYQNEEGVAIRTETEAGNEGKKAADFCGADLICGDHKTFQIQMGEALNQEILKIISKFGPDLILTHWENDSHLDHFNLAKSTIHCSRHVRKVLTYRSNWYASSGTFSPLYHVDISAYLEKKLELVHLFDSEMQRVKGIWAERIRSTASYWGASAGCKYAEAFGIIRWTE